MKALSKPGNPQLEARLIKKLIYGVLAGAMLAGGSIYMCVVIAKAIVR